MSNITEEAIVSIQLGDDTIPVGTLWFRSRNNKRPRASFEYNKAWLLHPERFALGPLLALAEGATHAEPTAPEFGPLSDSAPDRWGRMLMHHAEVHRAKAENRRPVALSGMDLLLGVNDTARMGALRFSRADKPDQFLATKAQNPIPPLVKLPELLSTAQKIDEDRASAQDIQFLLAPGSSLGGARPKASVIDRDDSLSIAKFPSANDKSDVIRWEAVALELAEKAGIRVPQRRLETIAGKSVLLLKRFDRISGQRIPFLSALSMVGGRPYEQDRYSYQNIAGALIQHGASPNEDLAELWRRIVFTIMVNNTDDHLRNHGFLYARHAGGWRLSPAYDINPTTNPRFLSTAINDYNTAADLDLARSVAPEFRLSKDQAEQIIREVSAAVSRWESVATRHGLSKNDRRPYVLRLQLLHISPTQVTAMC